MSQSATIRSVAQAWRIIKEMQLQGYEWAEDYREAGRRGIVAFLEAQMRNHIDLYLVEMAKKGASDRRNGSFSRHLLTEVGDIQLHVPRTRSCSAVKVIQAYARRTSSVDRLILACFVLGLSTRRVAHALLPILGEPVSPSAVSRIAQKLDQAVAAFHQRPMEDRYRVLIFDGVILARKTGAGAIRRPVLVALGLRPDGRKEILDFRLAPGESAQAWDTFLTDLYQRGLLGSKLELICADGGKGLQAALALVYPNVPVQLLRQRSPIDCSQTVPAWFPCLPGEDGGGACRSRKVPEGEPHFLVSYWAASPSSTKRIASMPWSAYQGRPSSLKMSSEPILRSELLGTSKSPCLMRNGESVPNLGSRPVGG